MKHDGRTKPHIFSADAVPEQEFSMKPRKEGRMSNQLLLSLLLLVIPFCILVFLVLEKY